MHRMDLQCRLNLTEWCKHRSLTPKGLIDRARMLRDQNNCDRPTLGLALVTLMRAENSLSTRRKKRKKKEKKKHDIPPHSTEVTEVTKATQVQITEVVHEIQSRDTRIMSRDHFPACVYTRELPRNRVKSRNWSCEIYHTIDILLFDTKIASSDLRNLRFTTNLSENTASSVLTIYLKEKFAKREINCKASICKKAELGNSVSR